MANDNRNPETDIYDYIVCGGGTSGSVVAARLAEDPNVSVLVIEAGQHNSLLENTVMVGGWSQNFDTDADWNIISEPSSGINDRQIKLSRGRFLGGCSGVNGTLCIRGTKQDYDDWKLPGWSGEEVFEYMKKAETFHSKEWFHEDKKSHGYQGPLDIEPHDQTPITNMIIESYQSQGLPLVPDMFATGDTSSGCGHVNRTVYRGDRTTAANYFRNKGSNLTIQTDTTVDKIVFKGEKQTLRAAGVDVIMKDGTTKYYTAREEIVVSSGAYCSPVILKRSGIGPKDELAAHGIPCKVDLPGVGQNLMDHALVFFFYEATKRGITIDELLYKPGSYEEAYRQWKEEKRGPLSTFPFGAFAYARLDERLSTEPLWKDAPREEGRDPMGLTKNQPNVELWNSELYGGPKQYTDFPDGENTHAFAMCAMLFAAKSRGSVTLKSADAKDNPVVDNNYLADPLDLLVLSEACKLGNEIVTKGKGTVGIVKGSWPPNLTHHKYTSREDWIPYVKDNATTCYHAGGTCKMGADDDPTAVLDAELRVRGVKGLRVADTSVMPLINQGHTQMPAYAIGEKAADLIKGKSLEI